MRITLKQLVGLGLLAASLLAAVASPGALRVRAEDPSDAAPVINVAPVVKVPPPALAPGAATNCPPFRISNVNLARNPSFETVGPNGSSTIWLPGQPTPPPSAALHWLMHSSGQPGHRVASQRISTTVPGPGGSRMLRFIAGGPEGGIFQQHHSAPAKLMFSAWVYVRRGHVVLAATNGPQGPSSWSTKRNEWEQLRVCTDGTVPTGFFSIYNQDPDGGEFFVDRVEIRETP